MTDRAEEEYPTAREVLMPRISDEVDEGVVVTWFVVPGAMVREGDLLAEAQVEKVSEEVRAPATGRVVRLLVEPGGVVAQGAPIAVLEPVASSVPGLAPQAPAPRAPAPARSSASPASPSARRLARELGVDLSTVSGSGEGGRIVEADVQAAATEGAGQGAGMRVEPLTPMRQAIARRLQASLASTAQLTITAEADVTDLAEGGSGLTAAVVRASALSLREHPRVGAEWTEKGLAYPDRIDVGVAVALEEGLVAPVVRSADEKSLDTLDREIADLARRARAGELGQGDTRGASFTVTNLGAHRVDAFTPVLDPPQTAILGVGRARPRPAVVNGTLAPRVLVVLSLTFDHRVLDGSPAAAFLDDVVARLEEPALLRATAAPDLAPVS